MATITATGLLSATIIARGTAMTWQVDLCPAQQKRTCLQLAHGIERLSLVAAGLPEDHPMWEL